MLNLFKASERLFGGAGSSGPAGGGQPTAQWKPQASGDAGARSSVGSAAFGSAHTSTTAQANVANATVVPSATAANNSSTAATASSGNSLLSRLRPLSSFSLGSLSGRDSNAGGSANAVSAALKDLTSLGPSPVLSSAAWDALLRQLSETAAFHGQAQSLKAALSANQSAVGSLTSSLGGISTALVPLSTSKSQSSASNEDGYNRGLSSALGLPMPSPTASSSTGVSALASSSGNNRSPDAVGAVASTLSSSLNPLLVAAVTLAVSTPIDGILSVHSEVVGRVRSLISAQSEYNQAGKELADLQRKAAATGTAAAAAAAAERAHRHSHSSSSHSGAGGGGPSANGGAPSGSVSSVSGASSAAYSMLARLSSNLTSPPPSHTNSAPPTQSAAGSHLSGGSSGYSHSATAAGSSHHNQHFDFSGSAGDPPVSGDATDAHEADDAATSSSSGAAGVDPEPSSSALSAPAPDTRQGRLMAKLTSSHAAVTALASFLAADLATLAGQRREVCDRLRCDVIEIQVAYLQAVGAASAVASSPSGGNANASAALQAQLSVLWRLSAAPRVVYGPRFSGKEGVNSGHHHSSSSGGIGVDSRTSAANATTGSSRAAAVELVDPDGYRWRTVPLRAYVDYRLQKDDAPASAAAPSSSSADNTTEHDATAGDENGALPAAASIAYDRASTHDSSAAAVLTVLSSHAWMGHIFSSYLTASDVAAAAGVCAAWGSLVCGRHLNSSSPDSPVAEPVSSDSGHEASVEEGSGQSSTDDASPLSAARATHELCLPSHSSLSVTDLSAASRRMWMSLVRNGGLTVHRRIDISSVSRTAAYDDTSVEAGAEVNQLLSSLNQHAAVVEPAAAASSAQASDDTAAALSLSDFVGSSTSEAAVDYAMWEDQPPQTASSSSYLSASSLPEVTTAIVAGPNHQPSGASKGSDEHHRHSFEGSGNESDGHDEEAEGAGYVRTVVKSIEAVLTSKQLQERESRRQARRQRLAEGGAAAASYASATSSQFSSASASDASPSHDSARHADVSTGSSDSLTDFSFDCQPVPYSEAQQEIANGSPNDAEIAVSSAAKAEFSHTILPCTYATDSAATARLRQRFWGRTLLGSCSAAAADAGSYGGSTAGAPGFGAAAAVGVLPAWSLAHSLASRGGKTSRSAGSSVVTLPRFLAMTEPNSLDLLALLRLALAESAAGGKGDGQDEEEGGDEIDTSAASSSSGIGGVAASLTSLPSPVPTCRWAVMIEQDVCRSYAPGLIYGDAGAVQRARSRVQARRTKSANEESDGGASPVREVTSGAAAIAATATAINPSLLPLRRWWPFQPSATSDYASSSTTTLLLWPYQRRMRTRGRRSASVVASSPGLLQSAPKEARLQLQQLQTEATQGGKEGAVTTPGAASSSAAIPMATPAAKHAMSSAAPSAAASAAAVVAASAYFDPEWSAISTAAAADTGALGDKNLAMFSLSDFVSAAPDLDSLEPLPEVPLSPSRPAVNGNSNIVGPGLNAAFVYDAVASYSHVSNSNAAADSDEQLESEPPHQLGSKVVANSEPSSSASAAASTRFSGRHRSSSLPARLRPIVPAESGAASSTLHSHAASASASFVPASAVACAKPALASLVPAVASSASGADITNAESAPVSPSLPASVLRRRWELRVILLATAACEPAIRYTQGMSSLARLLLETAAQGCGCIDDSNTDAAAPLGDGCFYPGGMCACDRPVASSDEEHESSPLYRPGASTHAGAGAGFGLTTYIPRHVTVAFGWLRALLRMGSAVESPHASSGTGSGGSASGSPVRVRPPGLISDDVSYPIHPPPFSPCLASLYCHNLATLRLRLYQLDRLTLRRLPSLHAHLSREGLSSNAAFASQWLLTLFSSFTALNARQCVALLDRFLVGGWSEVLTTALAVLAALSPVLVPAPMEDCLAILAAPRAYYCLAAEAVGWQPQQRQSVSSDGRQRGSDDADDSTDGGLGSAYFDAVLAASWTASGRSSSPTAEAASQPRAAVCVPSICAVSEGELEELEGDYLSSRNHGGGSGSAPDSLGSSVGA